jgi:hypothetical protein
MKNFYVFVEGAADKKFLHDYIEGTFGVSLADKNSEGGTGAIQPTEGWKILDSKAGEPVRQRMKRLLEKFEDCLPTKTTCTKNPLTIPAKKSKIYAYMEVLHGETKAEKGKVKDPKRDFKNTQHWDLNATAIKPLRDFLHQHLD